MALATSAEPSVAVSARTGQGIPRMLEMVAEMLRGGLFPVDLLVPYTEVGEALGRRELKQRRRTSDRHGRAPFPCCPACRGIWWKKLTDWDPCRVPSTWATESSCGQTSQPRCMHGFTPAPLLEARLAAREGLAADPDPSPLRPDRRRGAFVAFARIPSGQGVQQKVPA